MPGQLAARAQAWRGSGPAGRKAGPVRHRSGRLQGRSRPVRCFTGGQQQACGSWAGSSPPGWQSSLGSSAAILREEGSPPFPRTNDESQVGMVES